MAAGINLNKIIQNQFNPVVTLTTIGDDKNGLHEHYTESSISQKLPSSQKDSSPPQVVELPWSVYKSMPQKSPQRRVWHGNASFTEKYCSLMVIPMLICLTLFLATLNIVAIERDVIRERSLVIPARGEAKILAAQYSPKKFILWFSKAHISHRPLHYVVFWKPVRVHIGISFVSCGAGAARLQRASARGPSETPLVGVRIGSHAKKIDTCHNNTYMLRHVARRTGIRIYVSSLQSRMQPRSRWSVILRGQIMRYGSHHAASFIDAVASQSSSDENIVAILCLRPAN
ncbi:hypothetical protein FHL15_003997 [Xylaria flabelliformis]|uniref:Uncharacterized protein n=1 Tax=Xylaria flabelliformis TaxID=2512241 RepID=A0A553I3Z2_9PEZI|nr:hypothetical protein FHL15_003997 [Xylaria flabelliformis]